MHAYTEVAQLVHAKWLKEIWFFQDTPEEFCPAIALTLRSRTLPNMEPLIKVGEKPEEMFILVRANAG